MEVTSSPMLISEREASVLPGLIESVPGHFQIVHGMCGQS